MNVPGRNTGKNMATAKKQTKRKPSIRAKKAFDKMLENGGVVSTAMVEAGYSPNTAKTPQKLTESRAWQELMQDYLNDDALAVKHEQLLNAVELNKFDFSLQVPDDEIKALFEKVGFNFVKIEEIHTADPKFMRKAAYYTVPNAKAVKDALDMAYKLKGSYAAEKKVNLNIEVEALPEIKALTEQINAIHRGTGITSDGGATRIVGEETPDQE